MKRKTLEKHPYVRRYSMDIYKFLQLVVDKFSNSNKQRTWDFSKINKSSQILACFTDEASSLGMKFLFFDSYGSAAP